MSVALVFHLGWKNGNAEGEYKANTDTYAKHAQDEIKDCFELTDGTSPPECVRKVVKSQNEHERAEADLVAQTEMGLWALGMLVVTFLMAIVTGVGVWFVYGTLIATQKMAVDQKRIGRAQVRAYLTAKACRLEWYTDEGAVCEIQLENVGSSPTRGIKASGHIENSGVSGWREGGELSTVIEKGAGADIAPSGSGRCSIRWPLRNSAAFFEGLEPDGTELVAKIEVTWFDVFGDGQSARFTFGRENPRKLMTDMANPHELELVLKYWENTAPAERGR